MVIEYNWSWSFVYICDVNGKVLIDDEGVVVIFDLYCDVVNLSCFVV